MPDPDTGAPTSRLVFMGSPDLAVPSLRRLMDAGYNIAAVYTQPDRGAGRGRHLQAPPVKRVALEAGLPVFQPESLRKQEVVDELAALRPDLIVVVAFGQILRPAVLQIPRQGAVNVHASLLPRHRGASPVAGALLAGDERAGVSIMLMDEGLDTGPVLAQREEAILPADTAGSLSDRLAELGAQLLIETLPSMLAGEIVPSAQIESLATLTHKVRKQDGRIDWSLPAIEIMRRIRAYTPWPGALTTLDGAPLQILQAWPVAGERRETPGAVISLDWAVEVPSTLPPAAFGVQTSDGILLPLRLKRAGGKALSARDYLNGERGLIGRRLGS